MKTVDWRIGKFIDVLKQRGSYRATMIPNLARYPAAHNENTL
jgi:hypothetical protein